MGVPNEGAAGLMLLQLQLSGEFAPTLTRELPGQIDSWYYLLSLWKALWVFVVEASSKAL